MVRHGAKHDWYRNLGTGVSQPVPRHREIKDRLAKHILAKLDCRKPGRVGVAETVGSD